MDQDNMPRWNQEGEDELSADLPTKRTLFQQELIDLFRPRVENLPDADDSEEDHESGDTAESSPKKKTLKGWRRLFSRLVPKVASKSEEPVEKPRSIPTVLEYDATNIDTNAESTSVDQPEDSQNIDPLAEQEHGGQLDRRTTEPDFSNETQPSAEIHRPPDEEESYSYDQTPPPVPPPLIDYSSEHLSNVQEVVGAPSSPEILKSEHRGIMPTLIVSDFLRRRRARKTRNDVRTLKKQIKQQKKYDTKQEVYQAREHSKLRETDTNLHNKLQSLEQSQQADRQRLAEAALQREVRTENSAFDTKIHTKLVSLQTNVEHSPKAEVPKLSPNVDKTIIHETTSLVETYLKPEAEREKLVQPSNSQETKQMKKDDLPETYFEKRHEVLDSAKPRQKKMISSIEKEKRSASSGFGYTRSDSHNHEPKQAKAAQAKDAVKHMTDPSNLYGQSVRYGVMAAAVIVVLGLISYVVQ